MTSILQFLILATLISLEPSNWDELKFEDIPANRTTFTGTGISIEVDDSASPLVHIFPSSKSIRRIEVTGTVSGAPSWPTEVDDSLLRVGVIQAGETRLNAFQKLTAPSWLQRVDQLVGQTGNGVESILCYHLGLDEERIGQKRTNPNASIFEETIEATPDSEGKFRIAVEFPESIASPGLWILADGDDSGSSFQVRIESLILTE